MQDLFKKQKERSVITRASTAEERVAKLKRLREAVISSADEIRRAVHSDFRKPGAEAEITEIQASLIELNDAIRCLKGWMKPQRVRTPITLWGARSEIRHEPRGVNLIIGPWNYPFCLCIGPLVAAIAAGNTAIIKPSELTPATSRLVRDLVARVFDESEATVVEGDAGMTTKLLELPFDHIFFTGSTKVGRIIAEAAAKRLTPVTLELGGKSPAIIDESADLTAAAESLVWGKFVNAGQTCVAPDYVLVPEAIEAELVTGLKSVIERFYGPSEDARKKSPDLARIINERNYGRLKTMLAETVRGGARVAIGGETDDRERYIAPTVLTGVTPESPVMAEEIFGPILPILKYRSLDEAIDFVGKRDKPLALYVFGRDRERWEQVLGRTTAGGTCVNTSLVHLANPHLPFGGVGPSGIGNYHGFFGFRAFSHERAVLVQRGRNPIKLLFPPYNEKTDRNLRIGAKLI